MTGDPRGACPPGVDAEAIAALRSRVRAQRAATRENLQLLRLSNRRIRVELESWRRQAGLAALQSPGVSHVDLAATLLRGILASGPVPTVDVELRARSAGISMRTLARARRRVGVRAVRVGGIGHRGTWYCALPFAS